MRTIVYIDGFNLYYRLLRDNPQFKWLDLKALSAALLNPQNQIQSIRYYTARISGRVDLSAPSRQQVYLDALKTVPEITIHLGNFLVTKPWAGLVHPPQMRGGVVPNFSPPFPTVVKVWKTEEKGSDVNLGCHLVRDAFRRSFDAAAILSNDTDLVEPIRIVTQEMGLPVGLLCPVPKPAGGLEKVAPHSRPASSNVTISGCDTWNGPRSPADLAIARCRSSFDLRHGRSSTPLALSTPSSPNSLIPFPKIPFSLCRSFPSLGAQSDQRHLRGKTRDDPSTRTRLPRNRPRRPRQSRRRPLLRRSGARPR